MKRTIQALCLAALCFAIATAEPEKTDEKAAPVAPASKEMQAYQGFIGKWKVDVIFQTPKGLVQITDESVVEYVLNGNFIQAKTTHEGKPSDIQMGTYDTVSGKYRWWTFGAHSGAVTELIGDYDAETKTFKWKGTNPDGSTMEDTDRFVDADTFTFSIVTTSADKSRTTKHSGKSTRKK